MSRITRRKTLQILASAPLAAGFSWTESEVQHAHEAAQAARSAAEGGAAFQPRFFTAHEYQTVQVLTDRIIPKDDRSGSATEAGVPEFMDFMMIDQDYRQVAMRGGLAWLDNECLQRFNAAFVDCSEKQQSQVLDLLAWPDIAPPEMSHGVAFFNSFRDLTATGFWTSRMGMEDLQYMGNTYLPEWTGCPEEALAKLGVRSPDQPIEK